MAGDQPQMIFVIDRGEAEIDFGPAADAVHAGKRRHDHPRQVRRVMQGVPHLARLARAMAQHAPIGFFRGDDRQVGGQLCVRAAGLMGEGDVHLVHAVLKALQIIAGHVLDVPDLDQAFGRAVRKMRKRRRLAGAEIAEDEAQIFAGRISAQLHLAGKARFLGRLIDALAAAVELPAVIDATDAVLFDPAKMQRRAAMRAMVIDDLRLAGMRRDRAQNPRS